MPQTCLRRAPEKVAVATGDTLRHVWTFVADMPPTLQVVPVLAANGPRKLCWVQLSLSVGDAFVISKMIGGNFFRCECPSAADADSLRQHWHVIALLHPWIQSDLKWRTVKRVVTIVKLRGNLRAMVAIREYPCIYAKALREFKNQRIKKKAWQGIAKSLKAAHGVNLNRFCPFVYRMEMAWQNWRIFHDVNGLLRSVYGKSEACLRHTWSLSTILPACAICELGFITCYRRHACAICELGFEVSTARLRPVCDTPWACLHYYLGHSVCATAGMPAPYVN